MYKTIISLALFLIFLNINANAQVKEFKIIYGQKELIFHNLDTLDAKIFEEDTISIIPNLYNPMNKYSFVDMQIILKVVGNKLNTKRDTIYYYDKFQPTLSKNTTYIIKTKFVNEITILTNLKTTIANYKTELSPCVIRFYLKQSNN